MTTRLLEGVRVVEFSQFGSVPFGGSLLTDLGADVVKVEPLGGDPWRLQGPLTDTEGFPFIAWNHGKRAMAIDLKSSCSAEILTPLIRSADAVITNYRPGALCRLGIDYDHLRAIKEDLVYVAVTASEGEPGAEERAGYDLIGQVESGMLAADGKFSPDGVPIPVTAGAPVDMSTGYLTCFGLCAGLVRQRATGSGCLIETSLLATAMGIMSGSTLQFLDHPDWNEPERELVREMTGNGASVHEIAEWRQERRSQSGAVGLMWYYRCYDTADGTVAIACLTPAQQTALLRQADIDATDTDADIGLMLAAAFRRRPKSEWITRLEPYGVPIAVVRQPGEIIDDAATRAVGLIADIDEPHIVAGRIRTMGGLLRVDGERPAPGRPSPGLGQHTTEILSDLGISDSRISDLLQQGVVRDHGDRPVE